MDAPHQAMLLHVNELRRRAKAPVFDEHLSVGFAWIDQQLERAKLRMETHR